MAKNQRQRRPLQDDTRTAKQTVRERTQVSKRQRDRIEENRDRREQRRERNRLRRQTVDSVRSPKEDVRTDRFDSRLTPIEDTFLGRPVGTPTELPVLIGERWNLANNQLIADSTATVLVFDTAVFTTERNGYPALYTSADGVFRVPAGLAGIWSIWCQIQWASNTTGTRTSGLHLNGGSAVGEVVGPGTVDQSQLFNTVYILQESDTLQIKVTQNSGGSLNVLGNTPRSWVFAQFLGK